MGENREDRQSGDASVTLSEASTTLSEAATTLGGASTTLGGASTTLGDGSVTEAERQVFAAEVSKAVRYERGLVIKLGIALLIVALVIITRVFFFGG